ncbi:MAG: hypothetical protein Q9157_001227 [Trypethelium eluteriae]
MKAPVASADVERQSLASMAVASKKDIVTNAESEKAGSEKIVDFHGPDDKTNPINWRPWHKWLTVVLISLMTLIVNLATVMCAPAAPQILAEFKITSGLYSTILVSIWELGEVAGPLIIAPLAELYGKLPVYDIAKMLFIVFSVGAGGSRSLTGIIVCRFLNGVAVASGTLNPGIVGDLFLQEQRGRAMSVMSLAVLLGPTLGPIIGGYLSQAYGWRWAFWFTAFITAVLEVAFVVIFRETYKVTILRRKVAHARKKTGDGSLRPKEDLALSRGLLLGRALVRPLKIMCLSPIVILLALYTAIVYGVQYLIMTTITETFEDAYGFKEGPVGHSFLGLGKPEGMKVSASE